LAISTTTDLKAIGCSSTASSTVADFVYTITPPPPAGAQIAPATLPDATAGTAYLQTLSASTTASGPFTWSIASGTLPSGLQLDTTATGTSASVSGTPTAAGASSFTVALTNGTSSTTASYLLNINSAVVAPSSGGGGISSGGGMYYSAAAANTPPHGQVLGLQSPGPHPDGTLILSGQTAYLVKNGSLYGFRNPEEFKSYGYNFNQLVAASAADMALPTPAEILKAMAGTLVLDSSDNRTVYMIGENYIKRGFVSASVFRQLGYSFADLPKINLSDYPAGSPIASGSEAHPEGALVLAGQTVWQINNGARQGFESATVFNTYGFSFTRTVKANAADAVLAQGPLVKFRDGTLVSQNGTYYIISDGLKLPFASQAALASRGYSLTNVLASDVSGYTAGAELP